MAAIDLSNIQNLESLDQTDLDKLLNAARETLNKKKKEEQKAKEEQFSDEIEQWQERIKEEEDKKEAVEEKWDQKIEDLKKEKKEALAEYDLGVRKVYEEYNNWRDSNGLEKTSGPKKRKRSGKQYSYTVTILEEDENGKKGLFAKVEIDGYDDAWLIEIEGGDSVSVSETKKIFKDAGITDADGSAPEGRARGLVNKIRKAVTEFKQERMNESEGSKENAAEAVAAGA